MKTHPIVHVEIAAKDTKAASEFYKELCGWQIDHAPQFNYYTFRAEGGPGGGFTGPENSSGGVVIYVATDDIESFLKKAESLGGKTLEPKTEIPGIGWFAMFADPSGNRIGVYKDMNPQG